MYYTIRLHEAEMLDLCEMINKEATEDGQVWPPILGLYKSVVVALTCMRRNRVQAELADTYDVSQLTISRAITGITPLVGKLLRKYVPTADELDDQQWYVVDGTLLPCWSWAGHPELYSGRHKTTGMNVRVACTLDGDLAWISDPIDGALPAEATDNWIGDKGYVDNDMITPCKKPFCRNLADWEKDYNTQINKVRYVIERVIANFKTWRIMHTDYRRPLSTFTATISTVVSLHFYLTG